MTDLNKLRSEFEAQHNDKVFKIVKFDEATNAYCLHDHLPLTEINLSALAEINYGWDLWQKAKAQAVPEGYVLMPKVPSAEWTENFVTKRYAEHCEKYADSPWPVREEEKSDFENCFRKDIRRSHELIMKVLEAAGDQNENS